MRGTVTVGGFVLLLALHVGWKPTGVHRYLGWIPAELGYRLLWILGAWAWLAFVLGGANPEREA